MHSEPSHLLVDRPDGPPDLGAGPADGPLAGLPPRVGRLALGALGALTVVEIVAIALSPWLLVRAPLLLVGLSPSSRHLALAVLEVPFPWLVLVATLRRSLALAVVWLVGAVYGRGAIAWAATRFPRVTRFLHWFEGLLRRFGLPLLVLAPGFTPSLLAGVTGIRFSRFLLAIGLGNLGYTTATVLFGDAMVGWTRPLLAWLAAHVTEATAVCVASVLTWQLWTRLRRPRPA